MKLKNKVVLITGAASGIGKAIALKFVKEGAKIIINYNKSCKEAERLEEIIKKKGEAHLIKADISRYGEIFSLLRKTIEKYGRLDILINNASIFPKKNFFEYDEKLFDRIINTNLKSVFFCSQIASQYMLKQKEGIILNISSNAGIIPKKNKGIVYGLSKAGVINLTKSLALTLAPHIRINCIAPGFTETPMAAFFRNKKMKTEVEKKIPLQRVNSPHDIANLALFLVSDESKNITGQTFIIDGGFILK